MESVENDTRSDSRIDIAQIHPNKFDQLSDEFKIDENALDVDPVVKVVLGILLKEKSIQNHKLIGQDSTKPKIHYTTQSVHL